MATVIVNPGDDTGSITAGQIIPVGPGQPAKRAAEKPPRSVETPEGEEEIVEAVSEVVKGVIDIFEGLEDGIKQDNINRGEFTQSMVGNLSAKQPDWNYVVCHTAHTAKWDGVEGTDWYHQHQEFDIQVGGSYEIYGAASGEFTRRGDGGYLNWAWEGVVTTNDNNGAHLIFAKH
ncbi:hypothetical protein B0H13DRAFT_2335194 [Mycena leptocephala]|nr:hypothetical protein B0H13DRAFT_2335194 [Mycena leptocephala]